MMVLSFSLLYQFAPNIKLHLKMFLGRTFSAIGWIIATFFFRFYVENFGRYLIFGSLGGIFVFVMVVLLILLCWWAMRLTFLIICTNINRSMGGFA